MPGHSGQFCFYCDTPLYVVTIDHIVPQVLLRRYKGRVPARFWRHNLVDCCFACNNAKSDADPVEWAEETGNKVALARLASRFILMGVSPEDVAVLRSGRALLNHVLEQAA